MNRRERQLAVFVAVPGVLACLAAVLIFLWRIQYNGLGWREEQTAQEHYLAVGSAYSHGFASGFFLCFFLMLSAVALGTWLEQRRDERRRARATETARVS